MTDPAAEAGHYSVERYFALAECGIIAPDDRVELLDGLIVAMAAQSAPHAWAISRIEQLLRERLGPGILVRTRSTFLAGDRSVPEPDVAVLPGANDDYASRLPSRAHLLVEVADSSLIPDRLTKAAIYARSSVPCYWIVNLRDRCVESFRKPDRWKARYDEARRLTGDATLEIDEFPGVTFRAAELLPPIPADEES